MKEINIAQNITSLRKKKQVTQEQLAVALNISPQAVSKWETGTSQPDASTLPLIADYFNVSIDYLYYGKDITYDDIYGKNTLKVSSYPQMSKGSYDESLKIFASAHHGISHGNIQGAQLMYDSASHISNENGVSLLSGKGFGAIVTRNFFTGINKELLVFARELLQTLSADYCLTVIAAIISMSDISYNELKEKVSLSDEDLRKVLDNLISAQLVIETKSKHKSLSTTYTINDMYHTCLCILLAVIAMQKLTLNGISCCMGYGDFPIELDK